MARVELRDVVKQYDRTLAVAGVTRETPDPPGGRILRDERGEPSGVLIDTAQALVSRRIPPPDDAALRERILLADAEA
ncbi:MAG: hypothetical protein LOD91_02185, partial [Limnochordales bacterium]